MDRSLDDIIDDLSGESDRDQRERGGRLPRPRSRSPLGRRPPESGGKGSKRVYVYNLHYGVTWQDLKTEFKKGLFEKFYEKFVASKYPPSVLLSAYQLGQESPCFAPRTYVH